jgi:hypothetical protein
LEAGENDSLLRRSRAAPTSSRFEGRYLLFDQTVYFELALIRNVRAMGLPLSWQHLRGSAGHALRQAP